MRNGDVIYQTTFKHCQPTIQASFAAPKGRVAVMLLLGDADKKDPYAFDPNKALNDLGWIENHEFDAESEMLRFCAEHPDALRSEDGVFLSKEDWRRCQGWMACAKARSEE